MTSPGVPFRCQHEIPNIASIWTLHFRCFSAQHSRICSRVLELRPGTGWRLRCGRLSSNGARKVLVRASDGSVISNGSNTAAEDAPKADKGDPFAKFQGIIRSVPPLISNWSKSAQDALKAEKGDPFAKFQGIISSMPPLVIVLKRNSTASFSIGFCLATVMLFIVGRINAARKAMHERPGSVADLVRRGQLRSDRRGISRPLKYEDPFNNPLVKVGKKNSTVEICGKVYRLAPVTLTEEEQAIHKKRRSRAYQWKRPTMFLKEGDTIPPDVDPDTVRWIPANHPFATTANDIDEDLAQTNVYQKHGVPFRIQAEHEALQRKLEALQRDEKLDKLVIDRSNAKDFERPYKFQTKAQDAEHSSSDNQAAANSEPSKSKSDQRSSGGNSFPEDIQKP